MQGRLEAAVSIRTGLSLFRLYIGNGIRPDFFYVAAVLFKERRITQRIRARMQCGRKANAYLVVVIQGLVHVL